MRKLKRLSVAASLALAAVALMASAASAEVKWSHSEATMSGSLTLKHGGANATTCTWAPSNYEATLLQHEGEAFWGAVVGFGFPEWQVPCGTKPTYMSWSPTGVAKWESTAPSGYYIGVIDELYRNNYSQRQSAWPGVEWLPSAKAFEPTEVFVPYTNGSGSTPSKVTFNNTPIGETWPCPCQSVTATGTLSVLHGKENVTLSGK